MQLHCLAWLMSSHLVLLGCLPFWCFAVFRFQVREFDTAEQMHDWIESCHRHHREQWSLERSQAGSQNGAKFQNILGELRNSVYIILYIFIYITFNVPRYYPFIKNLAAHVHWLWLLICCPGGGWRAGEGAIGEVFCMRRCMACSSCSGWRSFWLEMFLGLLLSLLITCPYFFWPLVSCPLFCRWSSNLTNPSPKLRVNALQPCPHKPRYLKASLQVANLRP